MRIGNRCPSRALNRYLAAETGDLTGRAVLALRRHADRCEACAALRDDVRAIARFGSGLATLEPSPQRFDAVMQAVRALPAADRWDLFLAQGRKMLRYSALFGVVAAALWGSVVVASNVAKPFPPYRPTPGDMILNEALRPRPILDPNAVTAYMDIAGRIPDSSYFSWYPYEIAQSESERLARKGARAVADIRAAFRLPGAARERLSDAALNRLDRCVALLAAHGRLAQGRGDAEEACKTGLDIVRVAQDVSRGGGFRNAWWGLGAQRVAHRLIADNMLRLDRAANERVLRRASDLNDTRIALPVVVLDEFAATATMPVAGFGFALDRWVDPRRAQQIAKRDYFLRLHNAARVPAAFRTMPSAPPGLLAWRDRAWPRDYFRYHDLNAARNQCILVALRVQDHRLTHGSLPAELPDLIEGRFERIRDPITNVPLNYRIDDRAPGGFVLYSIGPDLHDDKGLPMLEDRGPCSGDVGVRPFAAGSNPRTSGSPDYRQVPFMLPPKPGPGYPPVPDAVGP